MNNEKCKELSIASAILIIAKLKCENEELFDALKNARDDVQYVVHQNEGYLPYKRERYEDSVEQLKNIDFLIQNHKSE